MFIRLVVGNGEEDRSVDAVRKAPPARSVIESAENLGSAGWEECCGGGLSARPEVGSEGRIEEFIKQRGGW